MKLRRMRWTGHVILRERGEVCRGFWWGFLKERDHLQELSIDGRIILIWIFKKYDKDVD